AALLTQQGRVVSDLRIYVLAEELWLDVPAVRTEAVRTALERFIIADDVELVADDTWVPLVCIEGPQAAAVLRAVTGTSMEDVPRYASRDVHVSGTLLRVAAATHTGENGYLLFGSPVIVPQLWEQCRSAGAEPVGMEALDVLRIEAGIPWNGRDMDESL